ncbi:MAG: tRNA preQ1(34) S-adenosylmethionine ribosyltransferase-isomerase QueA [Chromatiales bacterium]|nr:tRNA preQ1(34) S-adenosylmethionine ribosyltransferase-isomerase QueA [Chromatiales bacterium]
MPIAGSRRSEFDYELPKELIAQAPLPLRGDSRMLCLHGDELADRGIRDLPALLRAGDVLVFNDTRVIPARLFGVKASGGKVEVFVERVLAEHRALVQIRASKLPRAGTRLHLDGGLEVCVSSRSEEGFFEIVCDDERPLAERLRECGHMPLPPYITRADEAFDRERYQTVFAARDGAVAAPTAGLHFDAALLDTLAAAGIERAVVTLHVGAGTFQPVREEDLSRHRMHAEWLEVSLETCELIRRARARGGRVVAVGTTVVRALETASQSGVIEPYCGETAIFIRPGYRFRSVDMLLTNFHMPSSTLLMLVCAFAGTERMLAAYRHAVNARYRFYSYGDAMLVEP